jgi:hypothetical protein
MYSLRQQLSFLDNLFKTIIVAIKESLPRWKSFIITPPFPSPPISDFFSFINFITLASPTGDLKIFTLCFLAIWSRDMVEDKFVIKGVFDLVSL